MSAVIQEVAKRDRAVFINCPFDKAFEPTFDAIVLTVLACHFEPRCADDDGTISRARVDRIATGLHESKYSIHDLSRCRGEGEANLARMNMPLELGMAMEQGFRGDHAWMVLLPAKHPYMQYISDLRAYDPPDYDGEPDSVVAPLLAWLVTLPESRAISGLNPVATSTMLKTYRRKLVDLRKEWREKPPWLHRLDLGRKVVSQWEGRRAKA